MTEGQRGDLKQVERSVPKKSITTQTMADLYIKQGYFDRALDIYEALYNENPENEDTKRRYLLLKKKVGGVDQAVQKIEAPGMKEEYVGSLEEWLVNIPKMRRKV